MEGVWEEMICADTDALVSILRNEKGSGAITDKLDKEKASTTVINSYELIFGARISNNKEENIKEAEKLLAKLSILEMDEESAKKAAEIHAELSEKGDLINLKDIFIGAIAVSNGQKILTRNEKDFSRIKGLKIEKW